MNNNIKKLTAEAHEIFMNVQSAAREGEISWAQRDELVGMILNSVTDLAFRNQEQKARDLLHAWRRESEQELTWT